MKNPLSNLVDLSTIFVFYGLMWLAVIFIGKFPASVDAPLVALKFFGFPCPTWLWESFLCAGGIAVWLPILNPFRVPSDEYGGAHWATEREIKNKLKLYADRGVILAEKNGKYLRTDQPLSTLCYAPPGSGKTAGLIIPTLLSCGNSMIVNDVKGELLIRTGPRRSQFSKIFVFAPGEKVSHCWNPLSKDEMPSDWDDIQVHVSRVATSVYPSKSNDDDKSYFPKAARSLFMFFALKIIKEKGHTSFPEILDAALMGDTQEIIADTLEAVQGLPKRCIIAGNTLINKGQNEFGSILGTFQTGMDVFLDDRVAKNVSKTDFSLKDLRKERTTIYLMVKPADQRRLAPLLALFFELATLTAQDHTPSKDEFPITLVLDEFVRLTKMQEIVETPALGRGYKLNALYVCQSFDQIVKIYEKAGANELKNTASYHLFFSQNELDVAENISKSIGNTTRTRRSHSTQRGSFHKSTSESYEGVPLIRAENILSLKEGQVLLCMQNHFNTPVDAVSPLWFNDSALKPHVPVDLQEKDLHPKHFNIAVDLIKKNQPGFVVDSSLAGALEATQDQETTGSLDNSQVEAEIEQQITPVAKEDYSEEKPEETATNEPEAVPQVESQIAEQIEPEAKAEADTGEIKIASADADDQEAVARCSQCGRSTNYQNRIGETCMDVLLDGSICSGKFKSLSSGNLKKQAA